MNKQHLRLYYLDDITQTHVHQISYIDCYSCHNNPHSFDSNEDDDDDAAVQFSPVGWMETLWNYNDHHRNRPSPPPPLLSKHKFHRAIHSWQFLSMLQRVYMIRYKVIHALSSHYIRQSRAMRGWHGQFVHHSNWVDGRWVVVLI
jgi:streptomycin 6-kinase